MNVTTTDIVRYNRVLGLASTHDSRGKYSMVGAAYRGKKLIADGYNAYPVRRAGETYDDSYKGVGVHAELELLSKNDLQGAVLYLAGVKSTGHEITSKPCPRCNNLLINSKVKAVVYMDSNGKLVKVRVRDLHVLDVPPYKVTNATNS